MGALAVVVRPLAYGVRYDDESLVVDLVDGRTISVPLIWFPTLADASADQRGDGELLGDGEEVSPGHFYWSELDVDLGLATLEGPELYLLKALWGGLLDLAHAEQK